MELIDKATLVAEIKKRLKHNGARAKLDRSVSMAGREKEDEDILVLLDTLEVKEVEEPSNDLEEAAKFYASTHTEFFDSECRPHVAPAFIDGARWYNEQLKGK